LGFELETVAVLNWLLWVRGGLEMVGVFDLGEMGNSVVFERV